MPIDDLLLVSLATSLVGLKAWDVKNSPKQIKKEAKSIPVTNAQIISPW